MAVDETKRFLQAILSEETGMESPTDEQWEEAATTAISKFKQRPEAEALSR